MIWVIGDIHGLFDPLSSLFKAIHDFDDQQEPVEKIIFLGDYIDHGPCSKEVVDFILELEYDKILIMGNHEDMALRFINQDEKTLKSIGNAWFYNGGLKTCQSIYRNVPPERIPAKFRSGHLFRHSRHDDYTEKCYIEYEGFELPEKYERFIKDLQYVHREGFEINGQLINFTFCHGLPIWCQSLEDQRVKTYDEFNAYLSRPLKFTDTSISGCFEYEPMVYNFERLSLEYSFIWGRDYSFRYGYQGDVIVHGHTPVQIYDDYYDDISSAPKSRQAQFHKYYRSQMDLPFLFTRSPWAGYDFKVRRPAKAYLSDRPESLNGLGLNLEVECVHFASGPSVGVEAINLDTGAIIGHCLTAIGLSQKYLSSGLIPVLSSFINSPFADNPTLRFVHVDGFGGKKIRPKGL
jgi:predicted phosphodiesterase